MLLKPYIAHYKNKYPGSHVDSDGETYLNVLDSDGKLRVALIGSNGRVVDQGKILGAKDAHDLSAIPKDCRAWCDSVDGLKEHRDFVARSKVASALAEKFGGRVPGVAEIVKRDDITSRFVDEQFLAAEWLQDKQY